MPGDRFLSARIRPRRLGLAVLALLCTLALFCLSGCLSRTLVYPAPAVAVPGPKPPLEEVELRTASGARLVGWSFSPPKANPAAPVLLYFHGNGENLQTLELSGQFDGLRTLGLPFLALDYPGYGRSGGTPSEKGMNEAAEAALAWCGERRVLPMGWSLGSAVALQLAARHPERCAGLVLGSPWTSLPETARLHFPRWLVWMILWEDYASLEVAPRVPCPALVLHGEDDDLIPAEMGRRIARALPQGRFEGVAGAGHNDLLASPEAWPRIREFLQGLPKAP